MASSINRNPNHTRGIEAMFTYYRPLRLSQAVNRLFDESVVNPQLLNPEAAALRLEVLGDTVTIRGELPATEVKEGDQSLLHERRYGKFARSVTLPAEV